jgi:hypothetical protein
MLAMRVAHGLPTLFQNDPKYVWLFDASGVRLLDSEMGWNQISGVIENSHWALVDSNRRVRDPAPVIYDHGSPFFVVQAASPRDDRWGWVKYHGHSSRFYSKPFSKQELLQGVYNIRPLLVCYLNYTTLRESPSTNTGQRS